MSYIAKLISRADVDELDPDYTNGWFLTKDAAFQYADKQGLVVIDLEEEDDFE